MSTASFIFASMQTHAGVVFVAVFVWAIVHVLIYHPRRR